jgi:hypothetical protein
MEVPTNNSARHPGCECDRGTNVNARVAVEADSQMRSPHARELVTGRAPM